MADITAKQIAERLNEIERVHNVSILYAVESGSRVWGFASPDSDYDVRFVYVRPQEEYFRIERPRDTIELMDGAYDFSGWDALKALGLMRKGNASFLEWLHSDIVYLDRLGSLLWALRYYGGLCWNSPPIYHHYLSMALNNYRLYIQKPSLSAVEGDSDVPHVVLKKYLYVLRPLAALIYLEKYHRLAPARFSEVLSAISPTESVWLAIDELVERKMVTREFGSGPIIPVLNAWIEEHFRWFESMQDHWNTMPPIEDQRKLDDLAQLILTHHSPPPRRVLEQTVALSPQPQPHVQLPSSVQVQRAAR